MAFFSCWFLAEPDDAPTIRLIAAAAERRFEEWPHLILTSVDGPDVNKLERLTRPRRKGGRSGLGGKLLVRGKMSEEPFTCVSQVEPVFVHRLAVLDEAALGELARTWAQAIEGVQEQRAGQFLRDMADFARRAEQVGKPVLQLDVL